MDIPHRRRAILGAGAALLLGLGATAEEVTFSRDVAPILHRHCATCHRPGGSGPFSLIDLADARRKARQIAEVTGARYMPPWLPEEGELELIGARRLNDAEIELIRRWVDGGALPGDRAARPPAPRFPAGWLLGEPDVVLEMPEAYRLKAAGPDEYRNFVLPVPVESARWVAAVELRPANARVVHHGRIFVDPTSSSRRRASATAAPGFPGMLPGDARPPGGMILGWTPGKSPVPDRGLAWRVAPGSDLVIQLHLVPTGRPEPVRASIGLHFADGPPERRSFSVLLGSRDIDIPAGEADHPVENSYVLPVDVDVVSVYPHAHYLGKRMRIEARLPDGSTRTLLSIPSWDFDWQDDYWFVDPPMLPAGTTVSMRYTFDNSRQNVRNPSNPPRRVVYGSRSVDEMAECLVQVVPRDAASLALLEQDWDRHRLTEAVAYRTRRVNVDPQDAESHAALGASYLQLERFAEAITNLRRAVDLRPRDADVRNNLGFALRGAGRLDEAEEHLVRALRVDPRHAEALSNLAGLLTARGRPGEAVEHYRRLIELVPDSSVAHLTLALALRGDGRVDDALDEFLEAVRLDAESVEALSQAAWILAAHPDPSRRRPHRALELALRAKRLSGGEQTYVLATLAAAHAALGQFEEAIACIEGALERSTDPALTRELRRQGELYRKGRSFRLPGE